MTTKDSESSERGDDATLPPARLDQFRIELMARLKARRERAGLTCRELGTLAGLGVSYVGMMENGRINPRASTVLKLVRIMDERDGLDSDAVDAVRDLQQFVDDLRGWIGNTTGTLKSDWLHAAAPRPQPSKARVALGAPEPMAFNLTAGDVDG